MAESVDEGMSNQELLYTVGGSAGLYNDLKVKPGITY